jgi:hypothetical protein
MEKTKRKLFGADSYELKVKTHRSVLVKSFQQAYNLSAQVIGR